jgi:hypothetical protein
MTDLHINDVLSDPTEMVIIAIIYYLLTAEF